MKILHLSSERTWRGGEQQLAYLLEELRLLGTDCVVACRKGSAFETYCRDTGQPFVSMPFANELDLATALQVKQLCARQQIDIVHAHSGHSHAIAVWAHLLGNKPPIVLHRRVDFPIKRNLLSRFKYNYPGLARIICVSDAVKNMLSADLKHPDKCVTIYDGIDLAKFPEKVPGRLRKEYGIAPETPIVANVAALTHQKDYHTFIDTVALLVAQGCPAAFLAIGQGHLEQELKAYAQARNIAQRIIFTGFRTDIPQVMPELDVLLFSSRTEGLGSTILDAFACRVPVVATNAGGIPELIEHGSNGLLAPVGDSATLARHVLQVLHQPGLAHKLALAGQKAVGRYSKAAIAKQTLGVYQQVLTQT